MLFVIHAIDKSDVAPLRQEHYTAHRAHVAAAAAFGIEIVMSGPLVTDDGATPVGSHFVVQAQNRAAAEAFHRADPFFQAGIWQQSSITAFEKKRAERLEIVTPAT
jgi:uncharacterized protein YciI